MQSLIREIGPVPFPEFNRERHYMVPFLKREGLPQHLQHWQPTVDAMLVDIETDSPIYLMVDQGVVKANVSHRRPGMHIDGSRIPGIQAHSDPRGIHSVPEPRREKRKSKIRKTKGK